MKKYKLIEAPTLPFGRIVLFDGLGLDHDWRVAFLVELRTIGDGPDGRTGGQSQASGERREGGNSNRDDDFKKLFFVHCR